MELCLCQGDRTAKSLFFGHLPFSVIIWCPFTTYHAEFPNLCSCKPAIPAYYCRQYFCQVPFINFKYGIRNVLPEIIPPIATINESEPIFSIHNNWNRVWHANL